MADRAHITVQGRVQGVGYRYAAAAEARRLQVRGWVRNTAAGEVEAEFEGPPDAVEAMLAWCAHGPALARVTQVLVHCREREVAPRFQTFEIRP
jgi:acylphosphatase